MPTPRVKHDPMEFFGSRPWRAHQADEGSRARRWVSCGRRVGDVREARRCKQPGRQPRDSTLPSACFANRACSRAWIGASLCHGQPPNRLRR